MAKRRTKKRTHVGASAPKASMTGVRGSDARVRDPKSMVIRMGAGEVGTSISQLAADVRRVMEPGTASRLRERKANKLRDYATMCGPLGVTHLFLFSRSESGNTNLRLALTPRGPTLHFRVEKYSLAKDVQRAQRHPKGGGKEYITPPLLAMNNLTTNSSDAKSKIPKHLESLTTSIFQSIFPPINPQTTPLKSIRRVLLLNREVSASEKDSDDPSFILNFRHYAITTRTAGVSKALRRLDAAEKLMGSKSRRAHLPNLNKLRDIADYMVGGENGEGYVTDATSGSEMDTDNEVEVLEAAPRKVLTAKARSAAAAAAAAEAQTLGDADGELPSAKEIPQVQEDVSRRAVKLVELGPRMKLRLTKVEEGLCSGKIMWHEYIHKSKAELKALEKAWEKKRQEKEARKKIQKENVEKKRLARRAQKGGKGGDDEEESGDEQDLDSDDYDYMDQHGFDSDGLEGDVEMQDHKKAEQNGDWEDEEDEIADGA